MPDAEFRSYYGRPILKEPAWKQPDVPVYLFVGGMAGVSATMSVVADATRHRGLAATGRYLAAGGALVGVVELVHDLGRPERFLMMMRVFKPTSPLSVGSWILSPFAGLAAAAAAAQATGRLLWLGRAAGVAAGALGPAMATYTAVLLADTAVPAWHEAYPELPFLFGGSALTSAAGAALLLAPSAEHGPPRRMAVLGAALELAASRRVEHRTGLVGEPYRTGRGGALLRAGRALTVAGVGLAAVAGRAGRAARGSGARRGSGAERGSGAGRAGRGSRSGPAGRGNRLAAAAGGVALLAGGLATRFGVFAAGVAATRDPKYVVVPQRERMARRERPAQAEQPAAQRERLTDR